MSRVFVPAIAGLSYLGSGLDEPCWSPQSAFFSPCLQRLKQRASLELDWAHILYPPLMENPLQVMENPLQAQMQYLLHLRSCVDGLLQNHHSILLLGGDHSNAMAIWQAALQRTTGRRFGLLWIDAHMDSHTLVTTPTAHLHGMPLAALMGQGDPSLQCFCPVPPYLDPLKLFLLGVHCYEPAEEALLERLGVSYIERQSVSDSGCYHTVSDCLRRLHSECDFYGISIDLDGLSAEDAPAVGTPVPGGLAVEDVCRALRDHINREKLLALEIAEYYPSRDVAVKTQQVIADLVIAVFASRQHKLFKLLPA